ncbi:MAG: tRNA lysidine(34) synthetase TilS [Clostridia bacterium]|nr:tRNA lysidine(34) synthetase TilS [Clostridia bacterium]
MINKVISTIDKYNMILPGKTVVAAVSGGSDSMAMLFILKKLQERYGFVLRAAHVNHGIRGDEADKDELFVRRYCSAEGIPVDVLSADVIVEAERLGIGLEEAGRKVRYDFFDSFGKDVLVSTAHNATDRAETFLFNFARGSALRGLGSIPPVRENFIRPLIDCSKAEIELFCKENSIPFVTDVTNSDVAYSRNRIRHNVLPELRTVNQSFEVSASRCIDSLREDEAFLSGLADNLISESKNGNFYDAVILKNAPDPIKKRAVIKIIESVCGITPERVCVEKICDILSRGGSWQINREFTVRVRKGKLEFPDAEESVFESVPFCEGELILGNAKVNSVIYKKKEIDCSQKVSNGDSIYFLDYGKIKSGLTFRCRSNGDKISLKKRGCTKTLKKLFNELAIPPEKRNSLVVLADELGVLLVEGVGVDSRVMPDSDTEIVMIVKINR